ncbi:hypothetical protein C8Q74DRAFT_682953 [Fomes fomentarius]|nr:hypothetical protein C8Q74DRAFT_682953 [Fomes fomentarius]
MVSSLWTTANGGRRSRGSTSQDLSRMTSGAASSSSSSSEHLARGPRTVSAPYPEDDYTRFTAAQLAALEEVFARNQYPSRGEKTRLSQDFCRAEMSVENWFKRRRLTLAFGTGPSPELLPVRSEPSRSNRQYPPDEPRRPTKFTQGQLRVLSAAFKEDRFLKKTRRMMLAQQLGLTESSVQGWFERARTTDEGGMASSSLSRRSRA